MKFQFSTGGVPIQSQIENNDMNYAIGLACQDDDSEAVEMEHEWLKQKYGMNNEKAFARAESNLKKALKNNKIDLVTYHHEKSQIDNCIKSSYDDGTTCTKDLIEMISAFSLSKTNSRMLCSKCDHYASGFIDAGYGCGYRNIQVLFSSIREDPRLRDTIFNNNNLRMPSITKIQSLIEQAWNCGLDIEGKAQLSGSLVNTAKWIGATEVCAMFASVRIKCDLVDIQPAKGVLIGPILFKFVKKYFEEQTKLGQHIHPIYLQHDGHSRTIVGIECGKSENLLLFDPSTRKNKMDQLKSGVSKSMQVFRRNVSVFSKNETYQLVLVRDIINTDEEYERLKVLTSTRITC